MFHMLVLALAVAFAVLANWPCPELSAEVRQWREKGNMFFYGGEHNIFYIDEKLTMGNSQVLLLIHGFPTSSYDWKKIWPRLPRKFGRVIAYDMLGFGFSDKPIGYNYTIKEQASIALALLEAADVGSSAVHIMSHDYGDSVAQEILARFNEKELDVSVRSVCLLNGGVFQETNHPMLTQKLSALPIVRDVLGRVVPKILLSRSLSKTFGPDTQPSDGDIDHFWQLITHKSGHVVLGYLLGYLEERKDNDERWTRALSQAKIPVHAIYGPEDPINPPPFVEFYRETVPKGSIAIVKSAGHYPHWEDPESVWASYVSFLRPLL